MPKKWKKAYIIGDRPGKRTTIQFNLEDVAKAAGVTYDIVRAASKNKIFDRQDLCSIAYYIVGTHMKIKLKEGGYYAREGKLVA